MQEYRIQAVLKRLHSPDVFDLVTFRPVGGFGFLLQAVVGPIGSSGEEAFDVMVCTPDWFAAEMKNDVVLGRHCLFVKRYDYRVLRRFIEGYCASCHGETWEEVAGKLSRMGRWEFEDYRA